MKRTLSTPASGNRRMISVRICERMFCSCRAHAVESAWTVRMPSTKPTGRVWRAVSAPATSFQVRTTSSRASCASHPASRVRSVRMSATPFGSRPAVNGSFSSSVLRLRRRATRAVGASPRRRRYVAMVSGTDDVLSASVLTTRPAQRGRCHSGCPPRPGPYRPEAPREHPARPRRSRSPARTHPRCRPGAPGDPRRVRRRHHQG